MRSVFSSSHSCNGPASDHRTGEFSEAWFLVALLRCVWQRGRDPAVAKAVLSCVFCIVFCVLYCIAQVFAIGASVVFLLQSLAQVALRLTGLVAHSPRAEYYQRTVLERLRSGPNGERHIRTGVLYKKLRK
jgi:hypothetical protein